MALRARGDGAAGRAGVKIGVEFQHPALTLGIGAALRFHAEWQRYTLPKHQLMVLNQLSPAAGVILFSVYNRVYIFIYLTYNGIHTCGGYSAEVIMLR